MTKTKKELTEVKTGTLVSPIKTDATVDMNSIVAFFISKYETKLFDTKREVSSKINEINVYFTGAFLDKVKKEIKIEQFEVDLPVLGLRTRADVVLKENFLKLDKKICVNITILDDKQFCVRHNKDVLVSDALHTEFIEKLAELDALRETLRDTLDKITNVSRKEREIRGALAEKTLRESGAGELFNDPLLMKCIDLPTLTTAAKKK